MHFWTSNDFRKIQSIAYYSEKSQIETSGIKVYEKVPLSRRGEGSTPILSGREYPYPVQGGTPVLGPDWGTPSPATGLTGVPPPPSPLPPGKDMGSDLGPETGLPSPTLLTDTHLYKQFLPIVLRTQAINNFEEYFWLSRYEAQGKYEEYRNHFYLLRWW